MLNLTKQYLDSSKPMVAVIKTNCMDIVTERNGNLRKQIADNIHELFKEKNKRI